MYGNDEVKIIYGSYSVLCRWVQAECRKLGDADNPEVSELLKTAVRCLRERPVLFKYCAEEVMFYSFYNQIKCLRLAIGNMYVTGGLSTNILTFICFPISR